MWTRAGKVEGRGTVRDVTYEMPQGAQPKRQERRSFSSLISALKIFHRYKPARRPSNHFAATTAPRCPNAIRSHARCVSQCRYQCRETHCVSPTTSPPRNTLNPIAPLLEPEQFLPIVLGNFAVIHLYPRCRRVPSAKAVLRANLSCGDDGREYRMS